MSDRDTRTNEPTRQSTALTVVLPAGERRRTLRTASFALVHPDPSFVTQLIATAAQVPQTCTLRRASPQDAQTSYRAAASRAAANYTAANDRGLRSPSRVA